MKTNLDKRLCRSKRAYSVVSLTWAWTWRFKKCPCLTTSTKLTLVDLGQLCYVEDLLIPRKAHVTTLQESYADYVLWTHICHTYKLVQTFDGGPGTDAEDGIPVGLQKYGHPGRWELSFLPVIFFSRSLTYKERERGVVYQTLNASLTPLAFVIVDFDCQFN